MRGSINSTFPMAAAALAILLGATPGCKEDTQLRVTSIEPAEGDSEGGTYVRIFGNRFTKDGARGAKVFFGTRQAAPPSFKTDGEMVVIAPGGDVGKAVDILILFEPGGEKKLPAAFTYVERKTRTVDDLATKPK